MDPFGITLIILLAALVTAWSCRVYQIETSSPSVSVIVVNKENITDPLKNVDMKDDEIQDFNSQSSVVK